MAGRGDKMGENKLRLQRSLVLATLIKSEESAVLAIRVLKDRFGAAISGPGLLDFDFKQVNDSLADKEKFRLQGEHEKYERYSPLMIAVLINPEWARMLIEEGAAVAFKNKVSLVVEQGEPCALTMASFRRWQVCTS